MLRGVLFVCGMMLVASQAFAGDAMTSEEARRFVVGKMFTYNCFEGTRGQGRVHADGSVVGSIQFQGKGQVRYANLPAGTLQEKGGSVCASLRGLPFEPCFNLQRVDDNSFRGSISGLGFAYCEFTRHHGRSTVARSAKSHQPLGLRPSVSAEAQSE